MSKFVIEIADDALHAHARRIGLAMGLERIRRIGRVAILGCAEEIRLDGDVFREATEAEHAAIDPFCQSGGRNDRAAEPPAA